MHNQNQTVGAEQVSQDRLEAIFKLLSSGSSPEDISFAFKIDKSEAADHSLKAAVMNETLAKLGQQSMMSGSNKSRSRLRRRRLMIKRL
jgi:hypothetical protein